MTVKWTTLLLLVMGVWAGTAHAQIGYLWSIDELRARADLVAVCEWLLLKTPAASSTIRTSSRRCP